MIASSNYKPWEVYPGSEYSKGITVDPPNAAALRTCEKTAVLKNGGIVKRR